MMSVQEIVIRCSGEHPSARRAERHAVHRDALPRGLIDDDGNIVE